MPRASTTRMEFRCFGCVRFHFQRATPQTKAEPLRFGRVQSSPATSAGRNWKSGLPLAERTYKCLKSETRFYSMSRGIGTKDGKRLLAHATGRKQGCYIAAACSAAP